MEKLDTFQLDVQNRDFWFILIKYNLYTCADPERTFKWGGGCVFWSVIIFHPECEGPKLIFW